MKKLIVLIVSITIIMFTILYKVNFNNKLDNTYDTEEYKLSNNNKKEVEKPKNDMLAYTCATCETMPSTFPQKGEGYHGASVTCTNGATAVWNNSKWDIDFTNLVTPTNCTVNFADAKLYLQILADNPNVSTRTSFTSIFTTSNNGNTIYKASGQDGKDTYYFAGNVTNNYVYFANKYWRIVRINEDNSVRLIYAGTSATDTAGFSGTNINYFRPPSAAFYPAYMGYMFSSYSHRGSDTASDLKKHFDSWYNSNLSSYNSYISRTAIYCNDRTFSSGSCVWDYYLGHSNSVGTCDNSVLATYNRIFTQKSPSFHCENSLDRFTASNTTGNNLLTYPIATITVDEVAYAGAVYDVNNTSYYIYQNATGSENYWWTMSPSRLSSAYNYIFTVGAAYNGRISHDVIDKYNYSARPVISLKSCVLWKEGNGTTTSPYIVDITNSCVNSEN